ncbi:MAG TPA: type II toxin-antitoxin system HicB family antitoxin [Methanobacterium sp.]
MILQLPISIVEDGDVYTAVCPVFHIKSNGESMEDALKNIKIDLEKFLDDNKVQKEYEDVIKDYSIRDIEIVDIVVNLK